MSCRLKKDFYTLTMSYPAKCPKLQDPKGRVRETQDRPLMVFCGQGRK